MHVLVNTICGHMIGCSKDKRVLQPWKNKLVIYGHKVAIQERDFTDAEGMQLIDGERCAVCTIDGNTREVLR